MIEWLTSFAFYVLTINLCGNRHRKCGINGRTCLVKTLVVVKDIKPNFDTI